MKMAVPCPLLWLKCHTGSSVLRVFIPAYPGGYDWSGEFSSFASFATTARKTYSTVFVSNRLSDSSHVHSVCLGSAHCCLYFRCDLLSGSHEGWHMSTQEIACTSCWITPMALACPWIFLVSLGALHAPGHVYHCFIPDHFLPNFGYTIIVYLHSIRLTVPSL
ncbi:hypothetical protein DFS34DRAFT_621313 [Phlyctochytrium arcticum]|nr:hypothetical protein DFS34DRAFT_621313 [Phlyctochytrium arcticum]